MSALPPILAGFNRLLTCLLHLFLFTSLSHPTSACPTMRGYISRTTWGHAVLFSTGGRHGDDDDDVENDGRGANFEDPNTIGATVVDINFSPQCQVFVGLSIRQ